MTIFVTKQTLYRVENPNSNRGLWYTTEGQFNPFITQIPGAQCADLPMGFDEQFKLDGLDWVSACDNRQDLPKWFSTQDVVNLKQAGYDLYEFDVNLYRHVNGHSVFAREHVIAKRLSDTKLVWGV